MNFNGALLESMIYALAYVEYVAKRYLWPSLAALRENAANRHTVGYAQSAEPCLHWE